jgi:hypothetical protein
MGDGYDDYLDDGLCGDFGIEKGEGRQCTKERRHKDDHYDRVNDFSWPLDDMDKEYNEFFDAMMKVTTDHLKRMREIQDKMHWQFGYPMELISFRKELEDTLKGWVSSHC